MPLRVVNPFTQGTACEVPYDEGAGLEAKVAGAAAFAAAWRTVPLEERIERVGRGVEWFRAHAEEVARDVTAQMGKPLAQARSEVATLLDRATYMLSIAARTLAPEPLPAKAGFTRRIEHDPLGVVLNVAAWNYPLIIPVNVVVPALLAGNAVLLKHSAQTPLTGRAFARAFGELGVADLVLTHEATARLIRDPRIAHVAFTGSVEGGREVYRIAAERLIDAGLELGGKDPAYVAEDADLEFAAANLVDGACYNAGQSCCAVERVYVHAARYAEFLDRVRPHLEAYRMGDPLAAETTLGPLAKRSALATLDGQVADAVRRGARLVLGGARTPGTDGNFFPPTLLADVPQEAAVMQEESFGPLLPVRSVRDDAEALALMNDSAYGLTASVWTRDRERANRMARDLVAGTIYQNRCDYLDPALPWTGAKASGLGSTLSAFGFHHLTRRKGIHFRDP